MFVAGSFLNDLWVGPDGSVYVTDSSLPMIWRITEGPAGWQIAPWLDVSPTIAYTPATTDFDLGGIVTTQDDDFLLTSQGTTGRLWRIHLVTRGIVEVDLAGDSILNADGIVLKGRKLWVVQNFSRRVSLFELDSDWESARRRQPVRLPGRHRPGSRSGHLTESRSARALSVTGWHATLRGGSP